MMQGYFGTCTYGEIISNTNYNLWVDCSDFKDITPAERSAALAKPYFLILDVSTYYNQIPNLDYPMQITIGYKDDNNLWQAVSTTYEVVFAKDQHPLGTAWLQQDINLFICNGSTMYLWDKDYATTHSYGITKIESVISENTDGNEINAAVNADAVKNYVKQFIIDTGNYLPSVTTPLKDSVGGEIKHDANDKSFAYSTHTHPLNVSNTNPFGIGIATPGSASTYARSDHVHPVSRPTGNPLMNGTVSVGNTAAGYALGNHVHPTDTSRAAEAEFRQHVTGINPHGITKETLGLSRVTDNTQVIAPSTATTANDNNKLVVWSSTSNQVKVVNYTPDSFSLVGHNHVAVVLPKTDILYGEAGTNQDASASVNHRHPLQYSSNTPLMDGVGTFSQSAQNGLPVNTAYALSDHVHPSDTTKANVNHNHNDLYYTRDEVDIFIGNYISSVETVTSNAIPTWGTTGAQLQNSNFFLPPSSTSSLLPDGLYDDGNKYGIGFGGSSFYLARQDHVHPVNANNDMPTDVVRTALSTDNELGSFGQSNYYARQDHKHPLQFSNIPPQMDGVAFIGTGSSYALSNHVHPSDTSKANIDHNHNNLYAFSTLGDGSADRVAIPLEFMNGDTYDGSNNLTVNYSLVGAAPAVHTHPEILASSGYLYADTVNPGGVLGNQEVAARVDHQHPMLPPSVIPLPAGSATIGTISSGYALGNHVHPHDSTKADVDHTHLISYLDLTNLPDIFAPQFTDLLFGTNQGTVEEQEGYYNDVLHADVLPNMWSHIVNYSESSLSTTSIRPIQNQAVTNHINNLEQDIYEEFNSIENKEVFLMQPIYENNYYIDSNYTFESLQTIRWLMIDFSLVDPSNYPEDEGRILLKCIDNSLVEHNIFLTTSRVTTDNPVLYYCFKYNETNQNFDTVLLTWTKQAIIDYITRKTSAIYQVRGVRDWKDLPGLVGKEGFIPPGPFVSIDNGYVFNVSVDSDDDQAYKPTEGGAAGFFIDQTWYPDGTNVLYYREFPDGYEPLEDIEDFEPGIQYYIYTGTQYVLNTDPFDADQQYYIRNLNLIVDAMAGTYEQGLANPEADGLMSKGYAGHLESVEYGAEVNTLDKIKLGMSINPNILQDITYQRPGNKTQVSAIAYSSEYQSYVIGEYNDVDGELGYKWSLLAPKNISTFTNDLNYLYATNNSYDATNNFDIRVNYNQNQLLSYYNFGTYTEFNHSGIVNNYVIGYGLYDNGTQQYSTYALYDGNTWNPLRYQYISELTNDANYTRLLPLGYGYEAISISEFDPAENYYIAIGDQYVLNNDPYDENQTYYIKTINEQDVGLNIGMADFGSPGRPLLVSTGLVYDGYSWNTLFSRTTLATIIQDLGYVTAEQAASYIVPSNIERVTKQQLIELFIADRNLMFYDYFQVNTVYYNGSDLIDSLDYYADADCTTIVTHADIIAAYNTSGYDGPYYIMMAPHDLQSEAEPLTILVNYMDDTEEEIRQGLGNDLTRRYYYYENTYFVVYAETPLRDAAVPTPGNIDDINNKHKYALGDHQHPLNVDESIPLLDAGEGSNGIANFYARSDHRHPLQVNLTTNPLVDGNASPGSGNKYALSNHVHPLNVNMEPSYIPTDIGDAGAAGSSNYYARADHTHKYVDNIKINFKTPVTTGDLQVAPETNNSLIAWHPGSIEIESLEEGAYFIYEKTGTHSGWHQLGATNLSMLKDDIGFVHDTRRINGYDLTEDRELSLSDIWSKSDLTTKGVAKLRFGSVDNTVLIYDPADGKNITSTLGFAGTSYESNGNVMKRYGITNLSNNYKDTFIEGDPNTSAATIGTVRSVYNIVTEQYLPLTAGESKKITGDLYIHKSNNENYITNSSFIWFNRGSTGLNYHRYGIGVEAIDGNTSLEGNFKIKAQTVSANAYVDVVTVTGEGNVTIAGSINGFNLVNSNLTTAASNVNNIATAYSVKTYIDTYYLPLTGGILSGNLTPSTATQEIGSSANKWNKIYANTFEGTATKVGHKISTTFYNTTQSTTDNVKEFDGSEDVSVGLKYAYDAEEECLTLWMG